ncbi:hypothetical protein HQ459_10155 [bacterium]|nr:hypothetical protein [bacterium]
MSNISDHLKVAAVFAESVRRELRHLPAEAVANLTDGLESDIAASLIDGVELANPADYAADLLRGAGLSIDKQSTTGHSIISEISDRVCAVSAKAKTFTTGLAPAWWLTRAWVLTQVLGWVLNDRDDTRVLVGQWGEEKIFGVAVFIAVLYLSVVLGRRETKKSHIRNVITLSVVIAGIFLTTGQFQPGSNRWFEYSASPATMPCSLVPNLIGLSVKEINDLLKSGALPYAIEYYDKETMLNLTETIWNQDPIDSRKLVVVKQENPGQMACASPVILYVDEVAVATTTIPVRTSSTVARQLSTTTSSVVGRVNTTTSSVAKQVNKTTTSLSR